jgi:hypothetical protein
MRGIDDVFDAVARATGALNDMVRPDEAYMTKTLTAGNLVWQNHLLSLSNRSDYENFGQDTGAKLQEIGAGLERSARSAYERRQFRNYLAQLQASAYGEVRQLEVRGERNHRLAEAAETEQIAAGFIDPRTQLETLHQVNDNLFANNDITEAQYRVRQTESEQQVAMTYIGKQIEQAAQAATDEEDFFNRVSAITAGEEFAGLTSAFRTGGTDEARRQGFIGSLRETAGKQARELWNTEVRRRQGLNVTALSELYARMEGASTFAEKVQFARQGQRALAGMTGTALSANERDEYARRFRSVIEEAQRPRGGSGGGGGGGITLSNADIKAGVEESVRGWISGAHRGTDYGGLRDLVAAQLSLKTGYDLAVVRSFLDQNDDTLNYNIFDAFQTMVSQERPELGAALTEVQNLAQGAGGRRDGWTAERADFVYRSAIDFLISGAGIANLNQEAMEEHVRKVKTSVIGADMEHLLDAQRGGNGQYAGLFSRLANNSGLFFYDHNGSLQTAPGMAGTLEQLKTEAEAIVSAHLEGAGARAELETGRNGDPTGKIIVTASDGRRFRIEPERNQIKLSQWTPGAGGAEGTWGAPFRPITAESRQTAAYQSVTEITASGAVPVQGIAALTEQDIRQIPRAQKIITIQGLNPHTLRSWRSADSSIPDFSTASGAAINANIDRYFESLWRYYKSREAAAREREATGALHNVNSRAHSGLR